LLLSRSIEIYPRKQIRDNFFDKFLSRAFENDILFNLSSTNIGKSEVETFGDGFIAGAESTYKNTRDSVHIYNKFITSYWMQKDYQRLVNYFEEKQGEISPYQNRRSFRFYLIPHSYMAVGDIDNAMSLGKEYLRNLETIGFKGTKGFAHLMSRGYLFTNEYDNSLDWLDKAIELGYLGDISTEIFYEPLYDHPRFQELVEKQKQKREEVMALVATYNFPEPEDL